MLSTMKMEPYQQRKNKLQRWKEYLEQLLNVEEERQYEEAEREREAAEKQEKEKLSEQEVKTRVTRMKNFKAAGGGGISAEIYMTGGKGVIRLSKYIQPVLGTRKNTR